MLAYKQAYDCSGNPMGQLWRTNGTNGTAHARWVGWLDTIADYLLSLTDDAGALIPVVFRLFQELNGKWFWWGTEFELWGRPRTLAEEEVVIERLNNFGPPRVGANPHITSGSRPRGPTSGGLATSGHFQMRTVCAPARFSSSPKATEA